MFRQLIHVFTILIGATLFAATASATEPNRLAAHSPSSTAPTLAHTAAPTAAQLKRMARELERDARGDLHATLSHAFGNALANSPVVAD